MWSFNFIRMAERDYEDDFSVEKTNKGYMQES